ncbi:MAG TPA: response regulator transcription factor [Acidimicrobiales bacterium]|nr:response regulator transcription factor [Acidimicrobiales bacterium]
MTVRIVIVDDQPPFREAARLVVDLLDDFDVVGEATSGEEALAVVEALSPDLVLMDINLPGMSGVEATRRLRAAHPEVVTVLVSTYEVEDLPRGADSSGALAYVHKEHLDADLVEQLWRERDRAMWRTA